MSENFIPDPPEGEHPDRPMSLEDSHKVQDDLVMALLMSVDERLAAGVRVPDSDFMDAASARGDDLSDNANPYVPWSDRDLQYHCSCGDLIYSDTPHTH